VATIRKHARWFECGCEPGGLAGARLAEGACGLLRLAQWYPGAGEHASDESAFVLGVCLCVVAMLVREA
jgi:hypothetical protein